MWGWGRKGGEEGEEERREEGGGTRKLIRHPSIVSF